jgi:hypothetical protein
VKALRIALAAGKQNKLWDVVGLLYADQGEENSGWVTDAKIDEILAQVPGLDAAKVKKDAQSAAITKQMQDLSAEATQNGVQGTPSFSRRQPALPVRCVVHPTRSVRAQRRCRDDRPPPTRAGRDCRSGWRSSPRPEHGVAGNGGAVDGIPGPCSGRRAPR